MGPKMHLVGVILEALGSDILYYQRTQGLRDHMVRGFGKRQGLRVFMPLEFSYWNV